jgi:hypothetical protein
VRAQRLLAIGDEDEMDVVRHQAIGPDGDALLAALARQQVAIEIIVIFAEEHALAPITPLRHMVGKAGDDKSGDAGYGPLGESEAASRIGPLRG